MTPFRKALLRLSMHKRRYNAFSLRVITPFRIVTPFTKALYFSLPILVLIGFSLTYRHGNVKFPTEQTATHCVVFET